MCPYLDQWQHRLNVAGIEKTEDQADVYEMQEVRVELAIDIVVPKYNPVRVVDVSVAAKHLLVHVLDLILKTLGESRRFTNPAVCVFGDLLDGGELVSGREVTRRKD